MSNSLRFDSIKTRYLTPADYVDVKLDHKAKSKLTDLSVDVISAANDTAAKKAFIASIKEIKYFDALCIFQYLYVMSKLYKLSSAETLMLYYIWSKTLVWGKTLQQLSYSYIRNAGLFKSNTTINKALNGLLDKGLIIKHTSNNGLSVVLSYGINLEPYLSKHVCYNSMLRSEGLDITNRPDMELFSKVHIWVDEVYKTHRIPRKALLLCEGLSNIIATEGIKDPNTTTGAVLTHVEAFLRSNVRDFIYVDAKISSMKKDIVVDGKILVFGSSRCREHISEDLKYLKATGKIQIKSATKVRKDILKIATPDKNTYKFRIDIQEASQATAKKTVKYMRYLYLNRKSHKLLCFKLEKLLPEDRVRYYDRHGLGDYFAISNLGDIRKEG